MSLESARRLLDGFGQHLWRCRKGAGLSSRALGEELGMSHSIIIRIENGHWMPTPEEEQIIREWMVHHPVRR